MFATVPAIPACHPDRQFQQVVNLDGDRAKEQVTALDHHNCAHTEWLASVRVRDRCRTYELARRSEALHEIQVANFDGWTRRPEIFFVTSHMAMVVRFDDRPSGCLRPRTLFRFIGNGIVSAEPKSGGREIVVTEEGTVTRYRYDRKLDRYVRSA
jgi:hypothetical protein